MNDSGPRDYEREYTKALSHEARVRMGYTIDAGEVRRFVVQLECRLTDDWHPVVRFDHDGTGESEHAHDVTVEGVHMDVYRSGEQVRVEEIFPPLPAAQALTHAEEHISMYAERYITRYKEWHRTDHET